MRINIINPRYLADQHLIAEYNEIIMLVAFIKKYPKLEDIPKSYRLGQGHLKFFKDKITYLKKRHDLIKDEMKKRNFNGKKSISLKGFKKSWLNDWKPKKQDKEIIKPRLRYKINLKPDFYRYCSIKRSKSFFMDLIRKA